MKLNTILERALFEADADNFMTQLHKIRDENTSQFTNIRNSIGRKEIAFLARMVKRKRGKRGMTANIPEDILANFRDLGLTDKKGRLTDLAPRFIKWVSQEGNRSQEMKSKDFRNTADDYLRRGGVARHARTKQGKELIDSMSDSERDFLRKLYNREMNKKTRNLAKQWAASKPEDVNRMIKRSILDRQGNLTDYGEFIVNLHKGRQSDPNDLTRKPNADPTKKFTHGDSQRRREKRFKNITRPI